MIPDKILLTKIKRADLRAKLIVEGFIEGFHNSPYNGFSLEFSDYREYLPGDDLRYIDWKIFAKKEKYYIKKFQEETNLNALILLDKSASMGFENKITYASDIAGSLAYLLYIQRDAVGLLNFTDRIEEYLPSKYRIGYIRNIWKILNYKAHKRTTSFINIYKYLLPILKKRGLLTLISDLYADEDVIKSFKLLKSSRHDIIVFHVLSKYEKSFPYKGKIAVKDIETGEKIVVDAHLIKESYKKNFDKYISNLRTTLASMYIDYVPVYTEDSLDIVLLEFLKKRKKLN